VTISTPCCCTREEVKAALDVKGTARTDAQIDRILESSARSVEGQLHRKFYPQTATRYFDWPNTQRARSYRLWLGEDEVISVTSLVAGGVTVAPTDYFLEPANLGPPYDRVEIDLDSAAAFASGNTHQRAIALTGVFGWDALTAPAGIVAEALDASETGVDVSDSAAIGVGDLVLVDTECMLVTDKSMLTTAQTLQTPLTASKANVSVAVTSGAGYAQGEVVLLDAERMLIVDIAGNTLTVKRAWDGSVLASHTGSTIYAPRTLTVVRGAVGTTAATHLTSAPISRHVVPGLVKALTLAEALTTLLGEGGGYARPAGAKGSSERPQTGSIEDIRAQAFASYGRLRTAGV